MVSKSSKIRNQRGAVALEYAVCTAVLALALTSSISQMSYSISSAFVQAGDGMQIVEVSAFSSGEGSDSQRADSAKSETAPHYGGGTTEERDSVDMVTTGESNSGSNDSGGGQPTAQNPNLPTFY
ncbi:MAG: Flp family type IVb pilin [Bdellovibrionales bacterium]|nr:Flp family type IVb pilin [Bdellovibrionales bacterium]